jgi:hypothetical protein
VLHNSHFKFKDITKREQCIPLAKCSAESAPSLYCPSLNGSSGGVRDARRLRWPVPTPGPFDVDTGRIMCSMMLDTGSGSRRAFAPLEVLPATTGELVFIVRRTDLVTFTNVNIKQGLPCVHWLIIRPLGGQCTRRFVEHVFTHKRRRRCRTVTGRGDYA